MSIFEQRKFVRCINHFVFTRENLKKAGQRAIAAYRHEQDMTRKKEVKAHYYKLGKELEKLARF